MKDNLFLFLIAIVLLISGCSESDSSSFDKDLLVSELISDGPYNYKYKITGDNYMEYEYDFELYSSFYGRMVRNIILKKDGKKGKGVVESNFKWDILSVKNNALHADLRLTFTGNENMNVEMVKKGAGEEKWSVLLNIENDPIPIDRNIKYESYFFCIDDVWKPINYYTSKDFNINGSPVYNVYEEEGVSALKVLQSFWIKFNSDGSLSGNIEKQDISGKWVVDEDNKTIGIDILSQLNTSNKYAKEFVDFLTNSKYYKGDTNVLYISSPEKDSFIMFRPNW